MYGDLESIIGQHERDNALRESREAILQQERESLADMQNQHDQMMKNYGLDAESREFNIEMNEIYMEKARLDESMNKMRHPWV